MRALAGLQAARQLKERGNAAYTKADYERSAAAYTEALEVDTEQFMTPVLYGNRAQARLAANRAQDASKDCDAAIQLDAENVKLRLRRAACSVALKQFGKAKEDYNKVIDLEPDNTTAQEFLTEHAARSGGSGCDDPFRKERDVDELDPYELLGLKRDATPADIKSAYRKLALQWHPDKHSGSEDTEKQLEAEVKFVQINIAHDVLTDPIKKKQYDLGGGISDLGGGKRSSPPSGEAGAPPRRREPPVATHMHDDRGRSMPMPVPEQDPHMYRR